MEILTPDYHMHDTEKTKILIVDDLPQNLISLEALLQTPDRNIVQATSGNDALKIILDHDFALILLDVQMPGMDGFETAELIRKGNRFKHIPIIFVTAISKEQKHMFKGYETGAVDYLFKPLNPQILEAKVNVFIELYRKRMTLKQTTKKLQETIENLEEANKRILEHQNFEIEQERLKTLLQMAGATAHELGQPLTVLLGYIELMGLYKDNPEKLASGMAKVKEAGKRITSIVKKIQNIRQVETKPYAKDISIIDLDQS